MVEGEEDAESVLTTIITGRSSCNELLNIVHVFSSLKCAIGTTSSGSLKRLPELNFKTVAVCPEFKTPPVSNKLAMTDERSKCWYDYILILILEH